MHLLLLERDGLYVCELEKILQLPQYSVSRHLSILKMLDLVEDEKVGRNVLYRAVFNEENKDLFASVLSTAKFEKGIFEEDKKRLKEMLESRSTNDCLRKED